MRSVLFYYDPGIETLTPVELPARLKVLDVAVGSTHAVVITSEHLVYAFGENNYGQLGLGVPSRLPFHLLPSTFQTRWFSPFALTCTCIFIFILVHTPTHTRTRIMHIQYTHTVMYSTYSTDTPTPIHSHAHIADFSFELFTAGSMLCTHSFSPFLSPHVCNLTRKCVHIILECTLEPFAGVLKSSLYSFKIIVQNKTRTRTRLHILLIMYSLIMCRT